MTIKNLEKDLQEERTKQFHVLRVLGSTPGFLEQVYRLLGKVASPNSGRHLIWRYDKGILALRPTDLPPYKPESLLHSFVLFKESEAKDILSTIDRQVAEFNQDLKEDDPNRLSPLDVLNDIYLERLSDLESDFDDRKLEALPKADNQAVENFLSENRLPVALLPESVQERLERFWLSL